MSQNGSSMASAFHGASRSRICSWLVGFQIVLIVILGHNCLQAQTPSTGALTGVTVDTTGKILPGVVVELFNSRTVETQSTTSDDEGRFDFLLLTPGVYEVRVGSQPSSPLVARATVQINVTEVVRLEVRVQFKTEVHSVEVS